MKRRSDGLTFVSFRNLLRGNGTPEDAAFARRSNDPGRSGAARLGLLLLSLFLVTGAAGRARVRHVSQRELPGIEPGSQERTIAAALADARAGDRIIIHGGLYRERLTVEQSGSADTPISLEAADGEYVVLTGADHLTNWTKLETDERIYSTPWPHQFVGWNEHYTHPDDEYHRLIGRCEQVFINGYPLGQVLQRGRLGRGTFFADMDTQRLYIRPANDQDLAKAMVEASVRDRILHVKGSHVTIKGLRFRYAANRAQQGAVAFSGDHLTVEDCLFEYANSSGAQFTGENITVRNCVFQHNGQLGFSAGGAHGLRMTDCTVRNNNVKGFNRGWEAGGNKICLTRGAVLERSTFVENRGNGIWFDIGNDNCEVRNCLIACNEDAGIFYEISYGLHAHDNVIIGNGFAHTPGAWGASSGISLSSSPGCLIERNLLIGNKEGFNFREQRRTTPRIEGGSEPVWNHDQIVRHNVLAYNRDAQVWGWFDVDDQRHWPRSMQEKEERAPAGQQGNGGASPTLLEELNLTLENNLYWPGPGHGLFHWGVPWKRHKRYESLKQVQEELSLAAESRIAEFRVEGFSSLDLRLPADSPAIERHCYPQGAVPGVRLGIIK
ncbi:MAG: right-handed parallel beta-helix repeat-containing protein [Sedimentisphaerales bacterium]|nr:right-handed parallel beta-helix repeat-containing protein [Sedimentisphaerales bacterium]